MVYISIVGWLQKHKYLQALEIEKNHSFPLLNQMHFFQYMKKHMAVRKTCCELYMHNVLEEYHACTQLKLIIISIEKMIRLKLPKAKERRGKTRQDKTRRH